MRIQTFNNRKGLIYGVDAKRIESVKPGTLKIGSHVIHISSDGEAIMPVLVNGSSGVYSATFYSLDGITYDLANVTIKEGRIVPPNENAVEFMELRCRADQAEAERDALRARVNELEHIFDTNSLNFLIK